MHTHYTNTYPHLHTAHKFVKTYLSGIENKESPMNCSAAPFQNNVLTNAAYPGEATGPLCQCADSYFASESAINSLIQVGVDTHTPPSSTLALTHPLITYTLSQSFNIPEISHTPSQPNSLTHLLLLPLFRFFHHTSVVFQSLHGQRRDDISQRLRDEKENHVVGVSTHVL